MKRVIKTGCHYDNNILNPVIESIRTIECEKLLVEKFADKKN